MINKYEQDIQELNKKLNENEEYFNNEEENRIKKDNKIKRYEQEIQELNKKLNDYKNTEANIPYLETEEEAAENIADIYERRDNKARTFAPLHNVDDIEESDEEMEESDEEIDERTKKYMEKLFKKYDDTREKDTPTKVPQSVKKKIHQLKYLKV